MKPRLSDHASNRYSQFGEDGILDRIFEIVRPESRIAVELGAWDGVYLSNTANLWRNGWQGVLIEADPERFQILRANTRGYGCRCIQARVEATGDRSLEAVLREHGIGKAVDLLSLDVDGDDYHILAGLEELRPRVLCCEFNPMFPPEMDAVGDPGSSQGCSARALVRLAGDMDYALVAMTEANGLFVRREEAPAFDAYETSFEALFHPGHLTYLITGFDGSYLFSQEPPFGFRRPATEAPRGDSCYLPRPAPPGRRSRLAWLPRPVRGPAKRIVAAIRGRGSRTKPAGPGP